MSKQKIPPSLSTQFPPLVQPHPFQKNYFIPTFIAKLEEVNPPFVKRGNSNYVYTTMGIHNKEEETQYYAIFNQTWPKLFICPKRRFFGNFQGENLTLDNLLKTVTYLGSTVQETFISRTSKTSISVFLTTHFWVIPCQMSQNQETLNPL